MDLNTVVYRGLKIANTSADFSTEGSAQQLKLYPQLRYASTNSLSSVGGYLLYVSKNEQASEDECSADDFTVEAWRPGDDGGDGSDNFTKIGELELEPCASVAFMESIACCQFVGVPREIEEGDIFALSHGEESSLLHYERTDPKLQVLSRIVDEEFFTDTFGGYPLLTFVPGKSKHIVDDPLR